MLNDEKIKHLREPSVQGDSRETIRRSIVVARSMLSAADAGWCAEESHDGRLFVTSRAVCELLHLAASVNVDAMDVIEDAKTLYLNDERVAGYR